MDQSTDSQAKVHKEHAQTCGTKEPITRFYLLKAKWLTFGQCGGGGGDYAGG